MMRITLRGCPPSLNKFAGRENTWDYRNAKELWTNAVWVQCLNCKDRPKKPMEQADVEIMYFFPDRRRRDPDNYCGKLMLDGLTKAGVIVDDDMAHIRLHIGGDVDRKEPRTVITVRECEDASTRSPN